MGADLKSWNWIQSEKLFAVFSVSFILVHSYYAPTFSVSQTQNSVTDLVIQSYENVTSALMLLYTLIQSYFNLTPDPGKLHTLCDQDIADEHN